jgi:tellurite resistance protein TerC
MTDMNVSPAVWAITIAILTTVIALDIWYQVRNPKEPSFKSSAFQSVIYIGMALAFTGVVWALWGSTFASEYLAGFVTEKSLSVDNLFVFLILFTHFAVPRALQSQALLSGIVIALVMRGAFIAVGAALIEQFSWVFYVFGGFLAYTAVMLLVDTFKSGSDEEKVPGGKLTLLIQKAVPTVNDFHGGKLSIVQNSKRFLTPMALVMVAIGATDALFALDSIPAVYGLTSQSYIVFTANAFALLGLRQLYFMLSGLMERLKYLGVGLSIILGWIGLKLVMHALHVNELPFINGGHHVSWAPEIGTGLSLGVIFTTLFVTTVVSLLATRQRSSR